MDTTPDPHEHPDAEQGAPLTSDDLPDVEVIDTVSDPMPEVDPQSSELKDDIDSIRAIGEDR